jgi:uncharacterized protein (DUF427 family)
VNTIARIALRCTGRAHAAIWTYEEPYEAVAAIGNHVAFYPDRVDSIDERAH